MIYGEMGIMSSSITDKTLAALAKKSYVNDNEPGILEIGDHEEERYRKIVAGFVNHFMMMRPKY
ncbi:hypothetical protein CN445_27355 [Bacillus cereus]|nr:hypothetical protein bcere0029_42920 [Bacillus cereus AH1272]EEL91701.1 hypothetical protein bcere0030_42790 [Bacillus cereus AH1273]OJD41734.1 hypothetical protein BAU23_23300 [Bacillus nitratireducens]PEW83029.1 hypothetical protein CN445_27355 [Bacillus cereus]PFN72137.1 hypothetical protein COJ62_18310 [Bacillus cereus]